ncbi:hypothetical protein FJY71_02390 [candidate division WOR-3 bacterium]|nr:hypothetical protein [candidate division WOR-3 bacterium]
MADLSGPTNPLPPMPMLPANNETLPVPAPTLVVESGVEVGLYHFRVLELGSVAAEGYSFYPWWNVLGAGRLLQAGHTYQWTCRVRDAGGWSEWFSPRWGFSVGFGLRSPAPKLPEDGAVVHTGRPRLVVVPVHYPATYHFQVWDGRTLVRDALSDLPWWREGGSGGLEPGRQYTWTCRIEAAGDSSGWFSPAWRFEVAADPSREGVCADAVRAGEPVCLPNPFRRFVEVRVPGGAGAARAAVYSSDGRLVAEHLPVAADGCGTVFSWDGRDRRGAAVRPGTYLCRVAGAGGVRTVRLVKAGP